QDHCAHPGAARLERAQNVESRQARHVEIEQQKVRLGRLNDSESVFSASSLADHYEAVARIDPEQLVDRRRRNRQQLTQARSEHPFIVSDDDGCRASGTGLLTAITWRGCMAR